MSYNDYRKCAKCGARRITNASLRMHRFPLLAKNKENVNQLRCWATFCFPEKDWSSIEELSKLHKANKVLCGQHFSDSAYIGFDRKKLSKFAVPNMEYNKGNVMIAAPSYTESNKENIMVAGPSCSEHNKENVIGIGTSCTEYNEGKIIVVGSSPTEYTKENVMVEGSSSTVHTKENVIEAGPSGITPFRSRSILKNSDAEKQVRQTRNITLKDLKVSKLTQLTPRERKLYNRCKYLFKVVHNLRRSLKVKRKVDIVKTLHENEAVSELFNHKMSPSLALLLQGELQNGQRKLKGRRWSKDQKFLALELFKKSPSCYKLLGRLFCLPSISTIRNILNQVSLSTGINEKIFESLQKMVNHQSSEYNICSLTFDEMSIRKNLQYNNKIDYIEGYQDHGNQGRSIQVASHALVFMLVGLRKKWKQPIAYYLSGDSVTADRLSVIIKEVLCKCVDSGLNVVATICDNDGVNIKALELLGSTVEKPYIDIKGHEIVTLPDPPHLLKCFRNLFMKYNIECIADVQSGSASGVGIAKWKHIERFFELDNLNPHFVFAPALTKRHLNPNGKEKMRVKLAAQVFSHSVAAGIYAKIATNELPAEAATTANVIEKFDKLFDAVNADSPDRKGGKLLSTNLNEKSPHLEYFKKMRILIKKFKFVGSKRVPPSQLGWIKLLNGYERLWDNLKKLGITSIATRRLNQDPIENLFGCIRHNCGSNNNPTVAQFTAGLKTAIISNLRQSNRNRNCEDDNAVLVENFKSFFTDTKIQPDSDLSGNDSEQYEEVINCNVPFNVETTAETQACAYVCGYIFKRANIKCDVCKKAMLTDKPNTSHIFNEFKEYSESKHSLHYTNDNFIVCVESCAKIVYSYLGDCSITLNIKKNILSKLKENIDFTFLKICSEHYAQNNISIMTSVFYICVKRFCILKNRKFSEEAAKKSLQRKIKILKNV